MTPTSRILKRSLKICLIVGTALNLINQPEAIFGNEPLVIWKVVLTYLVPFVVATYGAVAAMKDQTSG